MPGKSLIWQCGALHMAAYVQPPFSALATMRPTYQTRIMRILTILYVGAHLCVHVLFCFMNRQENVLL